MTDTRMGVLALLGSCVIWGVSPLFYKVLSHVPAGEVLAHRTVWSLVFFAGVLVAQRRILALWQVMTQASTLRVIFIAALMISANWFLFIWSIQIGRATESSLGYYVYPLVAVLIGRVMFGERLSRAQTGAVVLAGLAVLTLTIGLSIVPWISLVLATTFGVYGLLKKRLALGPVISVTAEVLILVPLAVIWLIFVHAGGQGAFGGTVSDTLLLIASGPMTAMPLILFSYGARRLAMSTVGVLQYVNPTLQFLCAVVIFGEPFGAVHLAAFALIWTALALYSASAVRQDRARRKAEMVSGTETVVSTKSSSDASAKP